MFLPVQAWALAQVLFLTAEQCDSVSQASCLFFLGWGSLPLGRCGAVIVDCSSTRIQSTVYGVFLIVVFSSVRHRRMVAF